MSVIFSSTNVPTVPPCLVLLYFGGNLLKRNYLKNDFEILNIGRSQVKIADDLND